MNSLNKISLIGRVGKDPETRVVGADKAVTNFTLATSETYGKGAEKKETTQWHKLVAWDKLAQLINNYVKKGSRIFVDGKVTYEEYMDKENRKCYSTKIVVQNVILLDPKPALNGETPERENFIPPTNNEQGTEEDVPF